MFYFNRHTIREITETFQQQAETTCKTAAWLKQTKRFTAAERFCFFLFYFTCARAETKHFLFLFHVSFISVLFEMCGQH